MSSSAEGSPFLRAIDRFFDIFTSPVDWFREKVVVPNQQHYPYYHQKFRRVPTVDQCYTDDLVCIYEANVQYLRDRSVDDEIVSILRRRYEDCALYNMEDTEVCQPLYDYYKDAAADWFCKHGDMGIIQTAYQALMKQKHRMAWERRHGPVGSGMRIKNAED